MENVWMVVLNWNNEEKTVCYKVCNHQLNEFRTFRFTDKMFEFLKAREIDYDDILLRADCLINPLFRDKLEEFKKFLSFHFDLA